MLKAYAMALVLSVATPVEHKDGATQPATQGQAAPAHIWKPGSIGV